MNNEHLERLKALGYLNGGGLAQKKALSVSREARRAWIEPSHSKLSVARQCALSGLSRSSFYYERQETESEENPIEERGAASPFPRGGIKRNGKKSICGSGALAYLGAKTVQTMGVSTRSIVFSGMMLALVLNLIRNNCFTNEY